MGYNNKKLVFVSGFEQTIQCLQKKLKLQCKMRVHLEGIKLVQTANVEIQPDMDMSDSVLKCPENITNKKSQLKK